MDGTAEIRRIFQDAEEFQPMGGGDDGGAQEPPEEEPIEARCAEFPLNDYGNGQRFVAYFGADHLFVPRVGWHGWTGKVWKLDEDKIDVRRAAQRVAARILDEIPHLALEDWERRAMDEGDQAAERLLEIYAKDARDELTDADRKEKKKLDELVRLGEEARKALGSRKKSHRAHAKAAGNTGAINNMLTEASVWRTCQLEELNADPLAVNTLSGVFQFRQKPCPHDAALGRETLVWDFEILPHDRTQMISKIMPVEYDPAATCPQFDKFLERIQPNPEIREFLRRWFGYTLTGLTGEQKLVFAHGAGRNGKSTLVDTIAEMMADYAITVGIESFTGSEQRKGSDATPDLVRLPGARMVRSSEPESGQKFKEALIKALTGGEPIPIRRMHQEFFEVTPEFKLTIQGNHKPDIRGGDDGIWRRVLLVPFEQQIPAEEVDRELPAKLRAERSGIFNWLIGGLLAYLEDGLAIPKVIEDATAVYREESDPLRVFLLEHCEITGAEEDFVKSRDLIDAFRLWLEDRGEEAWTKRHTSNQIRARSGGMLKHPETGAIFTHHKRSDTGYLGLRLLPETAARLAMFRGSQDPFP